MYWSTIGSFDAGTTEEWRGGNPHKVEGGKGALMISADTTAEQKLVARGLLLDPGGGNISTGGGKIVYPEITGDWKRNNHEEEQGESDGGQQARDWKIQDPGGGENIDIGGSQPDFETCVASLGNHEVPRKISE